MRPKYRGAVCTQGVPSQAPVGKNRQRIDKYNNSSSSDEYHHLGSPDPRMSYGNRDLCNMISFDCHSSIW